MANLEENSNIGFQEAYQILSNVQHSANEIPERLKSLLKFLQYEYKQLKHLTEEAKGLEYLDAVKMLNQQVLDTESSIDFVQKAIQSSKHTTDN